MTDSITLPAAQIILSSQILRPIHRLPPEPFPEILGYLDQADLRRAAAVSRIFYLSAWRAGLYLHLNFKWHNLDCFPKSLATVKEAVNHVQQKGLRLSLAATFVPSYDGGDNVHEATDSPIAHAILDLLSSSLPVLNYLSIYTPGNFFPAVVTALRHSVPNLVEFDLYVDQFQDDPDVHRVPVDLFMKSAPKLRHLALKDTPLGRDPLPTFARVDTLTLDYAETYPDIAYAAHFPRLRSLHLRFYTEEDTSPPWSFRLDGVRLRKLTLGNCYPLSLMPSIQRSIKLDDVPDFMLIGGPEGDWTDPIWQRKDDGQLCMWLVHPTLYPVLDREGISIVIVPEHRRWRRTLIVDPWLTDNSFPALGLPGLAERLAYLRMENAYIVRLLECRGLVLRALRELRLDFETRGGHATMVWPPDWLIHPHDGTFSFKKHDASAPTFCEPSYSYIECNALQRLTLFAMDAVLRIESREVAFLGRALSQCALPKNERAELILIGMELTQYAHPLLDQTFSALGRRDFAGGDSIAGRDAGLWEDDLE